jgi:large subunit ribosomal protein L17
MRHYKKGRKLGTDASHTKAIKKNLAVAVFTNDRIKTTVTRAKEVRGYVERIVTWAKKGDLHSRRLAIAALGDKELVREVFEKAEQGMWADRNGGYTRIMKLGPRKGDNAPMAILELVEEAVSSKSKQEDKPKKAKKTVKKTEKAEEAVEVEAETEETPEVEAEEDAEEAVDEASEKKAE